MKIAPVAEVKAKFSAYLKESQQGPVVVTRNGKPVAILLSIAEDDDLERVVLANSGKFQAILAKARGELEGGEGLDHKRFWGELEPGSKTLRPKPKSERRRKR